MISVDEKYMRMCFALAKKGYGKVAPNPMVGCVVLDRVGNLISKGYHKKYGENHAERDALLKLKNNEAEGGNSLCKSGAMLAFWARLRLVLT